MSSKRKKYWWLLLIILAFFLLKTNYFRPMSNFGHRRTVKLDMAPGIYVLTIGNVLMKLVRR